MQELVGRLTSLDPEASETLKVITYFDHLVEGRVGVESMVRGAALLSGTVAGLTRGGRTIRIGPAGSRVADVNRSTGDVGGDASQGWPQRSCGEGEVVWLERAGIAHANDAMVLERLAHSVTVSNLGDTSTGRSQQSLEVLIDAASAAGDRDRMAARLGLEPRALHCTVATPGSQRLSMAGAVLATAQMSTAYGFVTASLVRGEPGPSASPPRGGLGEAVTVDRLPESWAGALLALRVATDAEPWVRVGDLGLLAQAVEAADRASSPPADIVGLERALAHGWSIQALTALADAESVRAVARAAGLHHSTLQARLTDLPAHLGFDLASGRGRARLHTALIVRCAANARFS